MLKKINSGRLLVCSFLVCFISILCLFSFAVSQEITAVSLEARVQKLMLSKYLNLLQEKGIFDSEARPIDNRWRELVAAASKAGFRTEKQVVEFILDELNFSPSNLAGFPDCAFDRPIGYKLTNYGKSSAPENIEARPEGSACPLGGIGSGAFERLMNGNFSTWFLKSGWMVEDTLWANQFHVFMKTGKKKVVQTLSTEKPEAAQGLQSWNWNYPVGAGSYYALYPKSGFSYEKNKNWPLKMAVVQFSPVIPHNYRETSFPVALFNWKIHNPTSEQVELAIMFTWENMVGWETRTAPPFSGQASFLWDKKSEGNYNEYREEGGIKGIYFSRRNLDVRHGNAMSGSMAIATKEIPGRTKVFYATHFDPAGDGSEIWSSFSQDGTISGNDVRSQPVFKDKRTAAALSVKITVRPGERLEIPFVVSWDLPFYEFEQGIKHRKKYTEYIGADGQNAFRLAVESVDRVREWENKVNAWQQPIVNDRHLPDWLKQAILNELYVLSETSIWDAETDLHTYLESVDYLMYGTFDVDTYCWHTLKLWPELEKKNLLFLASTVGLEDSSFRVYTYNELFPEEVPQDKKSYYWNTVKVKGMVPHDLGSPRKRPWIALNAFDWQNANVWKDLNPKYPLRALRYFNQTGKTDLEFLKKTFVASTIALDTLEAKFGDKTSHLPLNEGIPDQTYDTWRMKGKSSYVGFLWLAALQAVQEMAENFKTRGIDRVEGLAVDDISSKYRRWFELGRAAMEELWDEKNGYYHIDNFTDDIMTDQLFGVWYSGLVGLDPASIVPGERIKRSLRFIYEKNVLGYGRGLMGAVNGRTASGAQMLSQQGDEVWVGTSYAFASNLAYNGMKQEAMKVAYGLYHVVYTPYGQGYFFKTPEAYLNPEEKRWNDPDKTYGDRLFRAMKYMRPGAVWAFYEALKKPVK